MSVREWAGCTEVEVVPGKVSGVPILKGSRVQADSVVENYEAGETPEQIAENFDLDPRSVRLVLEHARSLRAAKLSL